MTIEECRTLARRFSRVDSTGANDSRLNELIQEAVYEFSNDVGGFAKDDYPDISAKFDTRTHFAIRVTITGGTNAMSATDVSITGTERNGTTGTIVAADFQITLRAAIGAGANATVTWSNFAFTVDTIDGTAITFAEPTTDTYADARDLLGLTGTTTEAAADHTGEFPEDCTVEYSLPSGFMQAERVEWNGNELIAAPAETAQSPEYHGTPAYYHIRESTLYLIPAPDQQGICHIWYRGAPTDIDFDTDASLPTDIPSAYQRAIPFLVAYYLLLEQFDDEVAPQRYGQYVKIMRQFRLSRLARNTVPDRNDYRRWGTRYTVSM